MTEISWSRTQRQLTAFIYRRVKDRAVADDITQDVLIKVFSKMTQLQDSERLSGWIYQIARNSIVDHFRTKSKEISVSDLDWESDAKSLNACVETCLNEMLLTLPKPYREALELVEIKNLSQQALAEKLGISYSGAKSRVQRARQMLKEQMDKNYLIKMDGYGNVIKCENILPCNCSRDVMN
jgi:RNA polymerase sigma-70 factor (ECF subfamily)